MPLADLLSSVSTMIDRILIFIHSVTVRLKVSTGLFFRAYGCVVHAIMKLTLHWSEFKLPTRRNALSWDSGGSSGSRRRRVDGLDGRCNFRSQLEALKIDP